MWIVVNEIFHRQKLFDSSYGVDLDSSLLRLIYQANVSKAEKNEQPLPNMRQFYIHLHSAMVGVVPLLKYIFSD